MSFECSSGSAAGIGRFLVQQVKTPYINTQNLSTLKFVSDIQGTSALKGDANTKREFDCFVAGLQPCQSDIRGVSDMFEVILYDKRAWLEKTFIQKRYNCQHMTAGGLVFDTSTLKSGTDELTWVEVLADIITSVGANINISNHGTTVSAVNPRNLVFDSISSGQALQVLAAHLFLIVGYNFKSNTVELYAPGQSNSTNIENSSKYDEYIINFTSGSATIRNQGFCAKDIAVVYPIVYRAGVPDSAKTQNKFYTKTITVNANGVGTKVLQIGNYLADHDGHSVTNSAELDSLASEYAGRTWTALNQDCTTYVYPCTVPFNLDGVIRSIKWTGDKTVVQHGNELSSNPLQWINKNIEYINNSTLQCIDGTVSGCPSGKVIVPNSFNDAFWARTYAHTIIASYPNDFRPCQWEYNFNEVEKIRKKYTKSGAAAWREKSGGRSGVAYNSIEDINMTVPNGRIGSGELKDSPWQNHRINDLTGVKIADVNFGTINPVPDQSVVKMEAVTFVDIDGPGTSDNLVTEYWFSYENSIEMCIVNVHK